ncbi:MAG: SdpI family protein [Ruminococcus sp.]|nr:SdpI family protein [Ruminococcus sp.]
MKKMLTKTDVFAAILTLCAVIPGFVVYNRLPEKVATHFNLSNEPDSFMPKLAAIVVPPVVMAVLGIICSLISSTDKRTENSRKVNTMVRFIIPVLAFVLEGMIILYALEKLTNVGAVAGLLISVLLIVIGNYMPKTRQNRFLGIKTPRTLSDERIWDKTHRFAGFVWTIGGIALLPLFILGMYIPAFILMTVIVLIPAVYSFVVK